MNNYYYVYVLRSEKDSNFYVGYSNDLRRRLKAHQNGRVESTKKRLPVKLIYWEGVKMLTGQLPFRGVYEQAVMYSILNEEPQPIAELRSDASAELQNIVAKALTKQREARYPDMAPILDDLKKQSAAMETARRRENEHAGSTHRRRSWLPASIAAALVAIAALLLMILPNKPPDTATTHVFRSIAVLPFSDLSPNKDQEYFCDGMTEEILTKLAQLQDLKVIARTAVMQYKNTNKTIR